MCCVAPAVRKEGFLERRVRSQYGRWEMNNGTPLWQEANFQVNLYKHLSSEPLLEVACRKSVRRCGETHMWKWKSKKLRSTPCLDHLWKLTWQKCNARCSGAKHIPKSITLSTTRHVTTYATTTATRLCYTQVHYTTLTTLDSATLTSLHYIQFHYSDSYNRTTLHNTLCYRTLYATLHYVALHHTTLRSNSLQSTPPCYTTLHCASYK